MDADITYTRVPEDNELEKIASCFCEEYGEGEHGNISDAEYDQLYDHLSSIISKYASYSDGVGNAEFMGSRYVDQIPWITLVADDDADPAIALEAALEAIQTAHRPLAVSFDYYPDHLMVLPPNIVYATFTLDRLSRKG